MSGFDESKHPRDEEGKFVDKSINELKQIARVFIPSKRHETAIRNLISTKRKVVEKYGQSYDYVYTTDVIMYVRFLPEGQFEVLEVFDND